MTKMTKKRIDFTEELIKKIITTSEKEIEQLIKEYKLYSKDIIEIYNTYRDIIEIDNSVLDYINYSKVENKIDKQSKKLVSKHYNKLKDNLFLSFSLSSIFYNSFKKEFLNNKTKIKEANKKTFNDFLKLDFNGKTLEERMNVFYNSLNDDIISIIRNGIRNNKSLDVVKEEINNKLNTFYNKFNTLNRTEVVRFFNLEQYKEIMNDENVEKLS